MTIILLLFPLVIAFPVCGYMLYRNKRVYTLRMKILGRISTLAREDIKDGRDWNMRYQILEKVGYDEMFKSFRKPMRASAYWKDLSFLDGEDVAI